MAPARESSSDNNEEYEEFIKKLQEYHNKRGTVLDPEPKIGPKQVNLSRLYKRVCDEGGYDRVSDTKGNKLAWRRLALELLGKNNATSNAFLLKQAYYKNLVAYEITTLHNKEPPPKEILEDVSARGGDVMSRTLENYLPPNTREVTRLANGEDNEDSDGSEEKTPKEEKMEVDEPGSTGRATRALRHAPPQRQLFQPEPVAARELRKPPPTNSPTPTNGIQSNGTSGVYGAAAKIASYEPRQPVPSAVKPVVTPANNPEHFKNLALRKKAIAGKAPPSKGLMLPGTGFIGPNIYIRALLALQSGEVEEESYALHHLVKISHERGDKYQFESFPGLAEALMAKVLQVSALFHDITWDISYDGEPLTTEASLDGLNGTPDLLSRIQSFEARDLSDDILTEDFASALSRVNEAALVLRNMVMLEPNAQYAANIALLKDLIVILLNLPQHALVVELRHYALEIAEQVTKHWRLESADPVYKSLLAHVDSQDRGMIITSLRAIARISLNLEIKNRLEGVPSNVLHRITDWLLVEDEELRTACLDFLYQFTAVPENVEILVHSVDIEALVSLLMRLLLFSSTTTEGHDRTRSKTQSSQAGDGAPKLSLAILGQLAVQDEPERSSQWLRTCFEENPTGEITQIELWKAYNDAFNDTVREMLPHSKPLMPAKEFITNVSTTFTGAQAQVITTNGQQKYTIRGIRPRAVPVSPHSHRPYIRCQWRQPGQLPLSLDDPFPRKECDEFASQPKQMFEHIMTTHLGLSRDGGSGKWILDQNTDVDMSGMPLGARYNCHWAGCQRYALTMGDPSPFVVGMHVKTHLPDDSLKSSIRLKHNRSEPTNPIANGVNGHSVSPPQPLPMKWHLTAHDERNDAAGLPLASVLVLRNLARQMAKLDYPGKGLNGGVTNGNGKRPAAEEGVGEKAGWVRKAFTPVKDQLFYVMAYNWTLRDYTATLWKAIVAGGGVA